MEEGRSNIALIVAIIGAAATIIAALIGVLPDVLTSPDIPTVTPTQIATTASMAPTVLATSTSTPIDISVKENSIDDLDAIPSIQANTQQPSIDNSINVTTDYPCEAQIIAPSGSFVTAISEVRLRPQTASRLSASPANPLDIGTTVIILRKDLLVNPSENWYEVANEQNAYLGWIPGTYLNFSNFCPDN
ncbi:MAG: hypothetical protein H6670_05550 [Anaerolineaceae bacterium]|nr:hypothetical protein [Anaerolineaceae bacterium]